MPPNPERSHPRQQRRQSRVPETPFWRKTRNQVIAGATVAVMAGGALFARSCQNAPRIEISIATGTPKGLSESPTPTVVFGPLQPTPELDYGEFTGEVGETSALIKQWTSEIGTDQQKFEQHIPRIAKLATTYFSKQMTEMFPEKSAQYDIRKLSEVLVVADQATFTRKALECNGQPLPAATMGFEGHDGKVYLNLQGLWKVLRDKQMTVEIATATTIHELTHFTAQKIKHTPPRTIEGASKPVTSQKGLHLFAGEKEGGDFCSATATYFPQLEEIVVEDSVTDLMQRVGVVNNASQYDQWVENYRKRVLTLPGLSRQQLLERHQSSDVIGFLKIIGKAVAGNRSEREQMLAGTDIAQSLTR